MPNLVEMYLFNISLDHLFSVFQNFAIFDFFFSFSLTWDHMGEKTSSDILSESAQQLCSQKFMHTPRKGVYQCCIKNFEISNFGFLAILYKLFFFGTFYMVVFGEL